MILRPTNALRAAAALLLAAAGSLAGCSGSVKVDAKVGTDKDTDGAWEATNERTDAQRPQVRRVSGRPPTATFPGFRVLDDDRRSSIVMVEVSREVDVKEQKAEGRLVYVMANTTVSEKVNRLPLVAGHFGTAVSRIYLEQAGADAMLVIETRSPVTATHRVVQTDNGVRVEVAMTGDPWGGGGYDARGPYQQPPPADAPKP